MTFNLRSRSLLTHHDLGRFPDDSLFHRVARVVCGAGCLPRKELYESWEVARRVRRRFRGGRVVDLACGHALTAALLLLLDRTSEAGLAVDARLPASAGPLHEAMRQAWPTLTQRLTLFEADLANVELDASDVIVSTHACGTLSDLVLERALSARARVAILPCCHDAERCDTGGLLGWLDPSLAIDATRAGKLRGAGYTVHTQTISSAITPKNRLLLGAPGAG
jgi:SAM-dependent methyltransferase